MLVQSPGYLDALRRKSRALVQPAIAACAPFVPEMRADPQRYGFSFDLAAAEKSFTGPTLIIAARQDTTVGYRDAWQILESYPRATFAVLDRADHVWPVESPDLLNALVNDWLSRIENAERSTWVRGDHHAFLAARDRASLAAVLLPSIAAQAQDWPAKPIMIYMGFPAGSGVDVVARMLQPSLEKSLGQRLVIDYKPGAGGNVASEVVARAAPDGYTFLLGTAATHGVNAALYKRLPFDVEADFTPISTLNDVSNVLMINPNVIDAGTVQNFIDQVKAAPGKYNYASTGNGYRPPSSATANLRMYVANLRRSFSAADPGVRKPAVDVARVLPGYRLAVTDSAVDIDQFSIGVTRAQRALSHGDTPAAVRDFTAALDLWRGRFVEDLPHSPTGLAAQALWDGG